MAWTKDTTSQSPKTVYTAPPDVAPMTQVVYDPNATNPWTVEYTYLNTPTDTQADIEALMGL